MAGPAGEIAKPLAKAATGDLVTIRGVIYRQVQDPNHPEVKFLEPIEVEAHVNPVSILTGLGIGAIGALALTIAWHGINIPSPLGGAIELAPGIKDTGFGKDMAASYERWKIRRRIRASGGVHRRARTGLTGEEAQEVLQENIGGVTCQLLNREWAKARRRGDQESADRFLQQAKDGDCPWVDQI